MDQWAIGAFYAILTIYGVLALLILSLFVGGLILGEIMEKRIGKARARKRGLLICAVIFTLLLSLFLQTIFAGGWMALWIVIGIPLLLLGGIFLGIIEGSIFRNRKRNKS